MDKPYGNVWHLATILFSAVAVPRLSREDWLLGAFGILNQGTIGDVKVEPLAKSLGVTKGSFYWHFDDRPALLAALLEYWVHRDTESVIALIGTTDQSDPVAALKQLATVTLGTPSEYDGVEAAIRDWAVGDPAVAQVCSEIDERRLTYVIDLLVAAGVDPLAAPERAHLFYRVVIGEYTWRRYGGQPVELGPVLDMIDHLARP